MQQLPAPDLPGLCIKPASDMPEELFYYLEPSIQAPVTFRSLDLSRDLDMIYDWVNQTYSRRFWQLNGTKELVRSTYEAVLQNPRAHSFIGCLNGQPICQIDVYGVIGEELEQHTSATPWDCGLHLLMLPAQQFQKGWSYYALKNFQRFYFSFDKPQVLFAEPDQANIHANKLAINAGFRFVKTIELSNKTANLYSITRAQFHP